tara:strand:+ start:822 stop:2198 length:1377 start_codon:yes stop_codon:yes gene_type:complete
MDNENATTPFEMRLSEVPSMPQPQLDLSYVVCIPSNGGVFKANQEVRLPLNTPSECFVDLKRAYIKYNLTNKSGEKQYLDPIIGGVSVIDNWRVVGGTGALMEEVIHYNNYFATLQANKNQGVVETLDHEMIGAGIDSNPLGMLWKTGETEANLTTTGTTSLANDAVRTITHRPASAFFNADRYMPLGYTQGTTYLSLTLCGDTTAMICANNNLGSGYETSQWELHIPVLRPGPEFASMFRSAMGSGVPIQIHSVGVHNTQQSITGGANSSISLTFSTRKRSVKALITSLRENAAITTNLASSVSGFVNAGITKFNFGVGGMRIPAQQIACSETDTGELISNTQLALGYFSSDLRGANTKQLSSQDAAGIVKQQSNYYRSAANDKAGSTSRCLFSIDLDSYNAAYAGKNLAGSGLPLVLHAQCGAGANDPNSILCDMYVVHDIMFNLEGQTGVIQSMS